jgi:hypothetical protein
MLNKKEKEELKALVEHEKRNLLFYALYYDMLLGKLSTRELEKAINFHLDRLLDLFNRLKD